ncbi:RNA polymerase sigma factor [Streptomyces sp. N35]|uniref:RNA polymerase sigma factor n=1 Tax=Streptomyces sp. N35 TaxID=2795730 RepID=UPI0018F52714|nr:sigma-70 family RNA polymerase sigma factor [Streptomyces sp. N35]
MTTVSQARFRPVDGSLSSLSDEELCQLVRDADERAFSLLWERHVSAVRAYAAQFCRGCDSDAADAVSEAMLAMLQALRGGRGPVGNVAGYLRVSARRAAARRNQRREREQPVADILDSPLEEQDVLLAEFDSTTALKAYNGLSDQWKSALRSAAIEEKSASQIAQQLGIAPASASSLVYRAKEALRTQFLRSHVSAQDKECSRILDRIADSLRGRAVNRYRLAIASHLQTCAPCRQKRRHLEQINSALPAKRAA